MMSLHRALISILLTLTLCSFSPTASAASLDENPDDSESIMELYGAVCVFGLIMVTVMAVFAIILLVKFGHFTRRERDMEWRIRQLEMRLKHEKRRRRAREIYIEVMEEEGGP